MTKRCVTFLLALVLVFACTNTGDQTSGPEELLNDTLVSTAKGNLFTAPQGWYLTKKGPATILEAPEKGSFLVLVDVEANDDSTALQKGWEAYKANNREVEVSNPQPDNDGWSRQKSYVYKTSPNEKRAVVAGVMFANDTWTVWIYDMANDVGGKRGAQVSLVFSSILPKGHSRESFAGMTANELNEDRISELTGFVEKAMKETGVPGVGLGIIENGKVVFADGFGVRELGKEEKVDANTLFLVASNTKAMTTLLLAQLVDDGTITWETPVVDLMPSFRLGSEETTKQTLVEHLICACTGLPRKDMEMLFEFSDVTEEVLMSRLAETEPTSGFGEMFQYSNSLAAAAGYVAGYVMFPELGIGEAYDRGMQERVFDPLGMKSTTFDYEKALAANHAEAHGISIDGEPEYVDMALNYAVIHARPAGGAWSSVNDMLKYIDMELREGMLPDGSRYIGKEPLLERRLAKVPTSEHAVYGMGLQVDNTYGVPVVHHGGDLLGHHSDMMWLPEYGIGAVVLTSGDPGWLIRGFFQRKLLEVLFGGKPEADEGVSSAAERFYKNMATSRENYTIPAESSYSSELADEYINESLGYIKVLHKDESTIFDFGEWKSEMATEVNPDGTVSFITIATGLDGLEFIVGSGEKKQLIMRDAQHEYVFEEK